MSFKYQRELNQLGTSQNTQLAIYSKKQLALLKIQREILVTLYCFASQLIKLLNNFYLFYLILEK